MSTKSTDTDATVEDLQTAQDNRTPLTLRWAGDGKIMRNVYVIHAGQHETSLARRLDPAMTTIFRTEDLRMVAKRA